MDPEGWGGDVFKTHGGGFLIFPAPVFTGMLPVIANATNAAALFPGYLAGAIGFRRELAVFDRGQLMRLAAVTLAGGLTGSLLLMISSNAAFSRIVAGLLLLATLVLLFGTAIAVERRHVKQVAEEISALTSPPLAEPPWHAYFFKMLIF